LNRDPETLIKDPETSYSTGVRLPSVSVLIVNYNGQKYLTNCLQSLVELNYPEDLYDIMVVDNASTDASVENVKVKFPKVKIISLDNNYGFCLPNNVGAKNSNADYVVFLNNDTIVQETGYWDSLNPQFWILKLKLLSVRYSFLMIQVGSILLEAS
jgi:glycosyltransferase involved in cell wall biosynthesis